MVCHFVIHPLGYQSQTPPPRPEPVPPIAPESVVGWTSAGQQPQDCRLERRWWGACWWCLGLWSSCTCYVQNGLQFHCNRYLTCSKYSPMTIYCDHLNLYIWNLKGWLRGATSYSVAGNTLMATDLYGQGKSHHMAPASGTPCGGGLKASSNIWCRFAFMDTQWYTRDHFEHVYIHTEHD